MKDQDHPILLFDGVCNLCNGFVQFVIKRDKKAVFRFAALQSDLGKELSATAGLPAHSMDTVVLYENNRFYTHSDVGLRVARRLNGLWPLAYALVIIPKFIRDGIYNLVAKNRYRWFGKRESCMVPTPELRSRFLDSVKKVHS